ncbi:MAG: hypothetical protein ABR555_17230 [Pyrinomonadaceae bacterium]
MDLSILPEELRAKAIILANEPAWAKESAREVITFLANNGYAVLRVEWWAKEGSRLRVLGWSDYNTGVMEDWDEYVRLNAEDAMYTVDQTPGGNELFNLTWADRDEILSS